MDPAARPCYMSPMGLQHRGPNTAKRNARERRRVEAVNEAFSKLRRIVPLNVSKEKETRVSKLKTLSSAIEYIEILKELLAAQKQVKEEYQDTSESWSLDEFPEDLVTYSMMYT